ncbi:substrate-binding domain-containing protein [Hyphomicrobiales bacterium BP6-180914]|uniref:Substrate-binding domain-containing protein n=1 Tax=Lichenifustis flavocetrariae TaxID=2949735 RepID=A0AA41Z0V3_9HYPH|nr:substrate-binding domain-containing protein [Lichenifustis flavocetrariae]
MRLRQPDQHDLVVGRKGVVAFGLYASGDYLKRHGDVDFDDGSPGHHLITKLDGIQDATQTDWLEELAPPARIAMQTSSHAAALAATVHGGGLASLLRFPANREPELVRLTVPPLPSSIPSAGTWLIVHKDNREMPRIRVTYLGEIDNGPDAVRKLCERLARQGKPLAFCDEAGPCGRGVHRQLTSLGHRCEVVATWDVKQCLLCRKLN